MFVLLLSLPLLFQNSFYQTIKLRTFDTFVPTFEESGYFTIINLDEEFVDLQGGYPIPRLELAKIHADIINAGALGVGWVLAMPHEDRLGGDEAFAEVLGLSNSVLSTFEYDNGVFPQTVGTVILGNDVTTNKIKGIINNVEPLRSSTNQGLASAPVEVDNLVRQIPLLYQTPEGWFPSYAVEVLKILVGADTYIIKTNELGIEEIKVQGLPQTRVDSLGRKWVSWVDTTETNLQELNVQGKFVFVGFTASGIMPTISTPVGLLEPHKIQTALAETLLIENGPYVPNWHLGVEFAIFVFSGLLIWLLTQSFGITLSLTLSFLLMFLTSLLGLFSIQKGILIDVTWSLIGQFTIASTSFYLRFREQYILRQQIKKQFEHYLDPRQVKKLQENPELLKLGGEKRYCTYMFTDVRGFTSMSEKLEPEKVTMIMNKALSVQANAVKSNQGMVDKYIGDAMMACWNAPLDIKNHQNLALKTAKQIIINMEKLNKELIKEKLPQIKIGIGINTGWAVVGNMGSDDRFEFTSLGDTVNLCARLESSTKEKGVDVLIGEETKRTCSFDLKKLDAIMVKGKSKKVNIYTFS